MPAATTARPEGVEMSSPTTGAQADGVVDEALLSYELVTRHPTKLGNLRVVVDEQGDVRVQRNDVEPRGGQAWSADLPSEPSTTIADAPERLAAILQAGHFFVMDELQVDEDTTDGTVRTLRWNGPGGPRTVTLDRARSPEFDQLIGQLARLLAVTGM
jgi:hypothetical protein